MTTYTDILGFLTLIEFVYALYIVPKAVGEMKGIYMETPDPFYGKFEADCKWTHGTTYAMGALSYIVIMPVLVGLYEQIMIHVNELTAVIIIALLLIPFRYYFTKQKPINAKKAYEKNIEDGYLKETDPMPNIDSRYTKIRKKLQKNK